MMRRKTYWTVMLVFLSAGAASAACGGPARGAQPGSARPVTSWDVDAPYSVVWEAAKTALGELGFVVAREDYGKQVIETDRKLLRAGSGYSACPGTYLGRVTLRFGEGVEGVRVNIRAEFTRTLDTGSASSERCNSTGELERELNRRVLAKTR